MIAIAVVVAFVVKALEATGARKSITASLLQLDTVAPDFAQAGVHACGVAFRKAECAVFLFP